MEPARFVLSVVALQGVAKDDLKEKPLKKDQKFISLWEPTGAPFWGEGKEAI